MKEISKCAKVCCLDLKIVIFCKRSILFPERKGLFFCIRQEGTWLQENRGYSIPPHVIAGGWIKELCSREKGLLWVKQAPWWVQWGDTCPELEEAAGVSGCSWTELFTLFSRLLLLLLLLSLLVFVSMLFPVNCSHLGL